MKLSRKELYVLQQALGLREMTLINTANFNKEYLEGNGHSKLVKETKALKSKVQRSIREADIAEKVHKSYPGM